MNNRPLVRCNRVSSVFECGAQVLNRRLPGEARFPLPARPLFAILGIAFALSLVSRMGRAELAIIAGTMLIALLNWLWARRTARPGAAGPT